MSEYVSPLEMTAELRRANLAALNARMVRATAKVAADPKQSRSTRDAAKRDLAAAQRIARKLS